MKKIRNKATTVSILKSMARVRYRNNIFLNYICKEIITSTKYSLKQIVTILNSFAILGYYSDDVNKLIEVCNIRITYIIRYNKKF